MENKDYMPRLVDRQIDESLKAFGIVQVEGARYCGKTWTCKVHSASYVNLADPSNGYQTKRLAAIDPEHILEGDRPRLVDEWQEAPQTRDAAKAIVSDSGDRGCFLFTGSASPAPGKGPMHGGEGRIKFIRMRPMSLFEQNQSNGSVSMAALFDGDQRSATGKHVSLKDLAGFVIRGGWPGSIDLEASAAESIPVGYVEALERAEIPYGNEKRYDGRKLRAFIRSYARNESTVASMEKIMRDVSSDDGASSSEAARGYLSFLDRIFVIEEQPAWKPSMRSATRVQQSPKRHFCDPSLAAAALNADVGSLIGDLRTFGFLFESLCTRDIRVYAQTMGGKVSHYRDDSGLEVDIIVEIPGGRWAAVEIKLGTDEIDKAARNLLSLGKTVDSEPAFMAVVVGLADYAYRREDGVFVIPISALGP